MRVRLDANMSFHKDRQSPPIIGATGWAAYRYPGSHRVSSLKCPYWHAQWARCAQPPVMSVRGFGPARRAPERRPMPPCPRAAPHDAHLGLPDFPGAATSARPVSPAWMGSPLPPTPSPPSWTAPAAGAGRGQIWGDVFHTSRPMTWCPTAARLHVPAEYPGRDRCAGRGGRRGGARRRCPAGCRIALG
jgi:hypothetical protein